MNDTDTLTRLQRLADEAARGRRTVNVQASIVVTAALVAQMFLGLDEVEQALFFEHVAARHGQSRDRFDVGRHLLSGDMLVIESKEAVSLLCDILGAVSCPEDPRQGSAAIEALVTMGPKA